jgi:transposase-like protein
VKGVISIGQRGYSAEQIVNKLREADVLIGQGLVVKQVCKRIGVTDKTYYRWRKEYGGLKVDQAKRLKELEKLAEAHLDKAMLQEVASGNF